MAITLAPTIEPDTWETCAPANAPVDTFIGPWVTTPADVIESGDNANNKVNSDFTQNPVKLLGLIVLLIGIGCTISIFFVPQLNTKYTIMWNTIMFFILMGVGLIGIGSELDKPYACGINQTQDSLIESELPDYEIDLENKTYTPSCTYDPKDDKNLLTGLGWGSFVIGIVSLAVMIGYKYNSFVSRGGSFPWVLGLVFSIMLIITGSVILIGESKAENYRYHTNETLVFSLIYLFLSFMGFFIFTQQFTDNTFIAVFTTLLLCAAFVISSYGIVFSISEYDINNKDTLGWGVLFIVYTLCIVAAIVYNYQGNWRDLVINDGRKWLGLLVVFVVLGIGMLVKFGIDGGGETKDLGSYVPISVKPMYPEGMSCIYVTTQYSYLTFNNYNSVKIKFTINLSDLPYTDGKFQNTELLKLEKEKEKDKDIPIWKIEFINEEDVPATVPPTYTPKIIFRYYDEEGNHQLINDITVDVPLDKIFTENGIDYDYSNKCKNYYKEASYLTMILDINTYQDLNDSVGTIVLHDITNTSESSKFINGIYEPSEWGSTKLTVIGGGKKDDWKPYIKSIQVCEKTADFQFEGLPTTYKLLFGIIMVVIGLYAVLIFMAPKFREGMFGYNFPGKEVFGNPIGKLGTALN
jgi:hypothetical protein